MPPAAGAGPVVLLELNGQFSVLPADSYAELARDVAEAYGHLVRDRSEELTLAFDWNGMTMNVQSEQTLHTFLALCSAGQVDTQRGVPVLRVARAKKVVSIPTLEEVEERVHSRAASRASSRAPSRTQQHAYGDDEDDDHGGRYSRGASQPAPYHDDEYADDDAAPVTRRKAAPPSRGAAGAARPTSAGPSRRKAAAPPASSRQQHPIDGDDALPVVDSPPKRQDLPSPDREVARTVSPPAAAVAAQPTTSRPNSAIAAELLHSFKRRSPTPPPTIRVLMRDGSASCKIPFDLDAPPNVAALRRAVWAEFGETLERRVQEIRATPAGQAAEKKNGKPIVAGSFLLSFWFEGCELPVDIEDHTDMDLLVRAVGKFGLDEVQIYADVPFVELPNTKPDVLTKTVLPGMPRGLQVNQTRIPDRSHVKALD